MLEVRGLVAGYATATVLRGIDLLVPDGRAVALLGRNGMGKTALLRAICGLRPPVVSGGSIAFDGVLVPEDAVLGEVNDGFKVMVTTLNGGRLFIAGLALASLAYALDRCRTYAQERIQFDDKPIGRFQRVQDVIVDMDIALEQGITWLIDLTKRFEAGALSRESAAKVTISRAIRPL